MKRFISLIFGLMILASCTSAGNPMPSKATQAAQGFKSDQAKDADQDFSRSDDAVDRRERRREINLEH